MSSIVILAPFDQLAQVSQEACHQLGASIPVLLIPLDDVVQAAFDAEKNGAEVIICRGTGAWRISQSGIQVPVVSIPITGYDLLRAFKEASKLGNRIGIADIPEVLRGVEALEKIFECEWVKYPIYSLDDMEPAIDYLKTQQIDVLVGKYIYAEWIKNTTIQSVVLSSGIESVTQAIHEAQQILAVRRAEMAQTKQLRAILDFIRDGVIAVDQEGRVTVCNPAVEKILKIPAHQLIGNKIDDILVHTKISHVLQSGQEEINRIQEFKGVKIITNRIPVRQGDQVIGVVSTFQEVSKLQQQEQEIRKKLSYRGHVTKYERKDVIGSSPAFLQAIEKAEKYAKADSTVLLFGETGVGKEVFAHLIHNLSRRAQGPFVAVNCAAIPEHLLESELFGYVEGAFTGAKKGGKTGLFELAHGGTIFLDEIGELSESLQVRLLRVLQEGEVMRLGDERVIPIQIRVITATNRDLEERVAEGKFRADLYYRINILQITVPPLRERKEDVAHLCQHFLQELQKQTLKNVKGFEPSAIHLLQQYHWPGNIRECRNLVERAVMLTTEPWITKDTVLEAGGKAFFKFHHRPVADPQDQPLHLVKEGNTIEDREYEQIMRVLQEAGGNRTEAARILGIGRSTLWRKLKKM